MIRRASAALVVILVFGWAAGPAYAGGGALPPDSLTLVAARPQVVEPGPWQASVFYTYDALSEDRPAWQTIQGYLGRRFSRGALVVEGSQHTRFEKSDAAVALDGYLETWRNAYGNVRVQYAPSPDFLALWDVTANLYQGIGGGWELQGGYGFRDYDEDVHRLTAGLGKYVARWYIRGRGTLIPYAGELATSFSADARRYWAPPSEYIEVFGGLGRGVEIIDVGPVVEVTSTYHAGLRVQKFLTQHLGVSLLGSYSDDEFYQRTTLVVGLLARW